MSKPGSSMRAPPQPLGNFYQQEDPITHDSEFQVLLTECDDFLQAVFSEWEKNAIPVVQENYMIRNTMLAQCYKDMEQFKHKYSIAEEEVANEF